MEKKFKIGDIVEFRCGDSYTKVEVTDPGNASTFFGKPLESTDSIFPVGVICGGWMTHNFHLVTDPYKDLFTALDKLEHGSTPKI